MACLGTMPDAGDIVTSKTDMIFDLLDLVLADLTLNKPATQINNRGL